MLHLIFSFVGAFWNPIFTFKILQNCRQMSTLALRELIYNVCAFKNWHALAFLQLSLRIQQLDFIQVIRFAGLLPAEESWPNRISSFLLRAASSSCAALRSAFDASQLAFALLACLSDSASSHLCSFALHSPSSCFTFSAWYFSSSTVAAIVAGLAILSFRNVQAISEF